MSCPAPEPTPKRKVKKRKTSTSQETDIQVVDKTQQNQKTKKKKATYESSAAPEDDVLDKQPELIADEAITADTGKDGYRLGDLSSMFSPELEQDVFSAPLEKLDKITVVPTVKLGKNARKKLRRKALPQPPAAQKEGDAPENKSKRENKDDEREDKFDPTTDPRLPRTIFVGNVPVNVKSKALVRLFRAYGPIESARFRSFGQKDPKLSKRATFATKTFHEERTACNAYIVFEQEEDARKALAHNGQVLEGHTLRVDMAAEANKPDKTRSVFVGNLPFAAKENELRTFFADCGAVENVRLVRDNATGIGRGFGFVLFRDVAAVKQALTFDQSQFAERPIRVFRAVDKPKGQNKQKQKAATQSKSRPTKKRKSSSTKATEARRQNTSAESWQGEAAKPQSMTQVLKKRKHAKRGKSFKAPPKSKPGTSA